MNSRTHADLSNPDYVEWLEFLQAADGWSAEQIAEYQQGELKRVVRLGYDHTTGYRSLFDRAGVGPETISSLDDIRAFPVVDKETIRSRVADFTTACHDREYVTTGGSTGIPFGFYRDRRAFARELASKAHQYHRIGWREGDPQLVLRGLPIKTDDHTQFVSEFNELRCSSYHLVPEWMELFCRKAWEYRPEWLRCYPSSGYLFAKWLRRSGARFPPLKGVLCASENLYDYQRELLREVFRARVFSHYGHYELAVLAGFCETEDTYHVLPHYGLAELVDPSGRRIDVPGQVGEIVGTSFIMSATPFIRYRTRDFARLAGVGCRECGRPYQVWDRIEGRLQEFIVTRGNRLISMTAVNFHDDIFDHIRQFQFHQRERGVVTFRYVPGIECAGHHVTDMKGRLMAKLGEDVDLHMEAVEDIPPTGRGKHRFLVQELDLELGDA
jgi:phenylacetate-CoA ligase